MPDQADHRSGHMPANWSEAFAALPTADPPDCWPALAAQSRRGRRRATGMLAVAATLLVGIALPWKLQHEAAPPPAAASTSDNELEALYAQSAQLEAVLAYARDDRVGSGSAETVAARLGQRLALIDAALSQPGLPAARQHALWQQRVATLRTLAGFETNRRLLSARGDRYDGVLVRVD